MTPQQKRAWYALAIGIVWSLALVAVFVVKGATAFDEDTGMRFTVYGLFIAGVLAYVAMMYITGWRMRKQGPIMDERDRMILRKVPVYQMLAVLVTLAAWSVILTEVYHEQGQVPAVFPTLMFFSAIIVNMVFASAGTLIAYWSEERHGQG
jgi:threonine/homoserine/homoserine lactone efflux protein